MFKYLIGFALSLTLMLGTVKAVAPEPASGVETKPNVVTQRHMVVAANPHAVRAGQQILEAGGSAVDAAIAVQMVLNVVEPQSSGIGGGGFLLHYDAVSKNVKAYDGRETAPQKISPTLFQTIDGEPLPFYDAVQGGHSVGVPGLLKMLKDTHDKHGTLPWRKLFAPAIEIAEDGFALSPRLHKVLSYVSYLPKFREASQLFLTKSGEVKPVGTLIKNSKLAHIFRRIAAEGIEPFYSGDIAQKIVDTVQNTHINPSVLSMHDMRRYQAREFDALCGEYQTYKVCGALPPSSGGMAIVQALAMLSHKEDVFTFPLSARTIHLIAEASKLAFADRNAYISDHDYIHMPTREMLDRAYLEARAARINEKITTGKAVAGAFESVDYCYYDDGFERESTTHISIVDSDGDVVSLTSSVENAFGSILMVDGFFLNNQLTDFAFIGQKDGKTVANRIEGGKRPRSSMAPTIILDKNGEFYMAVGSPGGSRIIGYVLQTILAVLDGGMHPQDAAELPHFIDRNGGVLELEEGYFDASIKKELEAMGHVVKEKTLNSGIHAIVKKDGRYHAGIDPRREGMAMGR